MFIFLGKIFLNSVEYLDEDTNEWTTFVPKLDGMSGSVTPNTRSCSLEAPSDPDTPKSRSSSLETNGEKLNGTDEYVAE